MITVSHLVKRFGRTPVLNDLSFKVLAGEAVALWGENGAGKTTTLKCLLGLTRFQGQATLAGHDVARDGKAARALIGYVPQELAFYDMSALETLRFYAGLKRVPAERAEEVLDLVGLSAHATKFVEHLSGGMKQRLALAIALLGEPRLLLLDEPTSNLDAAGRDSFIRLLQEQKAARRTILFSSHRLEELEALADRVLVLENGRLFCECAPGEVADRLGLTMRLKLHVASTVRQEALALLRSGGYAATPNGHGIWVVVSPTTKSAPIHTLAQAGITVTDFDLAAMSGHGEGEE